MPNTKEAAAAAGAAECAVSARLCDYKDCRKPLHKLLLCSKCKCTAYCCKECQVRPVSRAPVRVCTQAYPHACTHTTTLTLTPSPCPPPPPPASPACCQIKVWTAEHERECVAKGASGSDAQRARQCGRPLMECARTRSGCRLLLKLGTGVRSVEGPGEDAKMLTCGGCRVARFCSAASIFTNHRAIECDLH